MEALFPEGEAGTDLRRRGSFRQHLGIYIRIYATGASIVGSRKGSKQVKIEEEEGAHCPVVAS